MLVAVLLGLSQTTIFNKVVKVIVIGRYFFWLLDLGLRFFSFSTSKDNSESIFLTSPNSFRTSFPTYTVLDPLPKSVAHSDRRFVAFSERALLLASVRFWKVANMQATIKSPKKNKVAIGRLAILYEKTSKMFLSQLGFKFSIQLKKRSETRIPMSPVQNKNHFKNSKST